MPHGLPVQPPMAGMTVEGNYDGILSEKETEKPQTYYRHQVVPVGAPANYNHHM